MERIAQHWYWDERWSGEGLLISVMSLTGFILRILLLVTAFIVVFLLFAILKFNVRM